MFLCARTLLTREIATSPKINSKIFGFGKKNYYLCSMNKESVLVRLFRDKQCMKALALGDEVTGDGVEW